MMTNIDEAVVKSKRPADSAFKQQRLAAWQPILTAGTVLPTFFVIGIAFIPVGIGLLHFSYEVKEFTLDYTECKQYFPVKGYYGPDKCSDIIDRNESCICQENFTLTEEFAGKVYMYYGLSNFYQNHRRYVKSRDDNQLLGQLDQLPLKDCSPFDYTNDSTRMPIAPCGAIANSLFSDNLTILSERMNYQKVPMLRKGIAWPSDKQIKFRNPPAPNGNLSEAFKGYAKPLRWTKHVYELDPDDPDNNGFQNEDLIVWMRTAALPEFRKLYRLVNHSATGYVDGLPRGNYSLLIEYNYQVNTFNGTKYMILSTTSLLGGKNPFLGIAYIVVGSVCLFLGIVFLFIHVKCGKSTSEMINVNPRTPYHQ